MCQQPGSPLSTGALQTDGLLAMVRVKGDKVVGYVLGEGTYLKYGDQILVPGQGQRLRLGGRRRREGVRPATARKGLPTAEPVGVKTYEGGWQIGPKGPSYLARVNRRTAIMPRDNATVSSGRKSARLHPPPPPLVTVRTASRRLGGGQLVVEDRHAEGSCVLPALVRNRHLHDAAPFDPPRRTRRPVAPGTSPRLRNHPLARWDLRTGSPT